MTVAALSRGQNGRKFMLRAAREPGWSAGPSPLASASSRLLQRTCACGNHTLTDGSCDGCARDRRTPSSGSPLPAAHLHFQVHISGNPVDPAGYFTEPSQVVEASGSSATAIDKTLVEPCAPCAM
jgi:hypothetical protein